MYSSMRPPSFHYHLVLASPLHCSAKSIRTNCTQSTELPRQGNVHQIVRLSSNGRLRCEPASVQIRASSRLSFRTPRQTGYEHVFISEPQDPDHDGLRTGVELVFKREE